MSRRVNPLFYVFIALALFGLVSYLVTNPGQLLTTLLMTVGIATILFAIFYIIRNRSGSSGFSTKYKKAVKQSKKKYGDVHHTNQYARAAKTQARQKSDLRKKPKRNASHLRVIEGKKDKKKDRALY